MREHCLSEFNFHDPYMKQKQMENDHALGLLQERLTFLQDLPKVGQMISFDCEYIYRGSSNYAIFTTGIPLRQFFGPFTYMNCFLV